MTAQKKKRKPGRPRNTYGKQLSQQHFLVVEYYIRGASKAEALRKAGYALSTCQKQQNRIFDRDDVKAAIQERRWEIKTRNNGIVDRIQEELANIAFFNIGEVMEITESGDLEYDFSEATMEQFAAIGEVSVIGNKDTKRVRVKPYDKKAALDSLARINGMFNDNISLHSADGSSLEERLAAGRKRLNAPDVIDAEFRDVTSNGNSAVG